MANKYYAVKGNGIESTIFDNWPECQAFVKGKFVKYRGFTTEDEAKEFLYGEEVQKTGVLIYVDGSYMHKKSKYGGWGYVIVKNGIELITAYGRTENLAESRNIDGELEATINAINWSEIHLNEPITICHDYIGISKWAKGEWKANKPLTQKYKSFMMNKKNITFKKVAAHTGNKWNEVADQLAKKGIMESLK